MLICQETKCESFIFSTPSNLNKSLASLHAATYPKAIKKRTHEKQKKKFLIYKKWKGFGRQRWAGVGGAWLGLRPLRDWTVCAEGRGYKIQPLSPSDSLPGSVLCSSPPVSEGHPGAPASQEHFLYLSASCGPGSVAGVGGVCHGGWPGE